MSIDTKILSAKINAFYAGKLAEKTASSALALYTSQDPYTNNGTFVRNPSCWLNGVSNISCISPAQMSGANWWQRGGCLITPRHVLFAKHFAPAVISGGTPLRFVTSDSVTVSRNITQIVVHPCSGSDIAIALLDADMPSTIKPAKVLPKNWGTYFAVSSGAPIYAVATDQEEKALLKHWSGFLANGSTCNGVSRIFYSAYLVNVPSGNPYASFTETVITGDSGNPVFVIVNNELVVLTTWWTSISGPFVTGEYDTVNDLIETLSPGQGYALMDCDLAAAYESMQKMYFSPVVDSSETTLGNWFQDRALTIPAQALPAGADIPVRTWNNSAQRVSGGAGFLATV